MVLHGSVQAVFQHGIMAPLRRPRRDPPLPEPEEPQHHPQRMENHQYLEGGDAPAPQYAPWNRVHNARVQRNNVHQRRANRVREEPVPIAVQTLRAADPQYSEDDTDSQRHQESPELQGNTSAESDAENQQETQENVDAASASGDNTAQPKTKNTKPVSSQSKNKTKDVQRKEDLPRDKPCRDGAAARCQPAEDQTSHTDDQVSYS